jgi:hypothetical protein
MMEKRVCAPGPQARGADEAGWEERGSRAVPIWHSRLYQQRRTREIASRLARERRRRLADGTFFRETHALADHLLKLCETAELVLCRQGGDIAGDLEHIADLQFIVSSLDTEIAPGAGPERLEELRNYLEAMVLAIEVARVADRLGLRSRSTRAY